MSQWIITAVAQVIAVARVQSLARELPHAMDTAKIIIIIIVIIIMSM